MLKRTQLYLIWTVCLFCLYLPKAAFAETQAQKELTREFTALYSKEWGSVQSCSEQSRNQIKLCSNQLRNEGNSPFILYADNAKASVVLFHGLSDSPYYLRSIAEDFNRNGYTVIVPLLPGHGKLDADADMQDPALKQRWLEHVDSVMSLASANGEAVFIGGFSAGAALATHYTLQHPAKVKGLLLYSGALALSGSAEAMASIWGMKHLAVWLDGKFVSDGPNRYRYPKVASFSGLLLMEVIKEIREMLKDSEQMQKLEIPIFAAHSEADNISPYSGIEDLLIKIAGEHTQFKIDKGFDVCHGDLVISSVQAITMDFDKSRVNQSERCAVPKANPLHQAMLSVSQHFLANHN